MNINQPNPCPWWCTTDDRDHGVTERVPDGQHFSTEMTSPLTLRKPDVDFNSEKQTWEPYGCHLKTYGFLKDPRDGARSWSDDTGSIPRVVIEDGEGSGTPTLQMIELSASDARALASNLLAVADMVDQEPPTDADADNRRRPE